MSGFKALNVDSESEEEIDNTKEIQLEEAFKLYQNALKLHSQGEVSYGKANEAYRELFRSEVFKYPEAISEFAHDQLDDDAPTEVVQPEMEPVVVLPSSAADTSATSVPQIVYLSYKNKGEFALDKARAQLHPSTTDRKDLHNHYDQACNSSLRDFAEALERDDTDIDLWKKAARAAEGLGSQRIARFCYESVLAGDDDGSGQTIDLSGLDEAYAAGELEQLHKLFQDDLSLALSSQVKPKKELLTLLSKSNDPYPFLPKRGQTLEYFDERARPNTFKITRLRLTSNKIATLGKEILQLLLKYQDGDPSISAHSTVSVDLPDMQESPSEMGSDVFVDADEMAYEQTTSNNDNLNERTDAHMAEHGGSTSEVVDATGGAHATAASDPAVTSSHRRNNSIDLPTRKRSSTAAGNEEIESRSRSKRLRARESMADSAVQEEEAAQENIAHQSWNWTVLQNADGDVFKVLDYFLTRLQIDPFDSVNAIRAMTWPPAEAMDVLPPRDLLHSDLGQALRSWTDNHSQALINGHGYQDFVEKSAGLTLFLQHSKSMVEVESRPEPSCGQDDLAVFVKKINDSRNTLYGSVYSWLETVLATTDETQPSSYLRETWSEDHKRTIVQLLVNADEMLLSIMMQRLQNFGRQSTDLPNDQGIWDFFGRQLRMALELAQTIFELHIDILSRITNPSSQVQQEERVKQADRLERWAAVTDDYMRLYVQSVEEKAVSKICTIRFIWATTIYAGKAVDIDQDHVIQCLWDLKSLVEEPGFASISLPNNAAMPQISPAAADQEISRLSTLDFFMSVFDNDNSDPVAIIEKLEPILERDLQLTAGGKTVLAGEIPSDADNLIQFLNAGDASLKLFLWRRLQNAYVTISYTPRVVSCMLRSIEVVLNELCSSRHAEQDDLSRQIAMLKWFKDTDDLLHRILSKALSDLTAFDVLDAAHLSSSISALSAILKLLHVAALNEDSIRFGHVAPPQFKAAASMKLWEKSKDRFREMQVHLWTLQYLLLKDATTQDKQHFPDPANDLADYLCTVHHALGQRHYCKHANKQFVKLVKNELNSLETTNDYSADIAQVCFDLYQLKFKIGQGDFDHGCPSENLDRKTAVSLIPTVVAFARRMDMKDLIKGDLRNTIDKVQAATGVVKAGKHVSHNKKLILAYLRSPIIPEDLYKAIKGVGDLASKPIIDESSVKAKHGWFFLLGHMTLAKYRSVKRVSPTPTDDLENASQYLQQDLHHDMEKWETWYRLAQVFEAKIEDDLIWNSTKLNDARDDIALLERNSIHCFTMAIAVAMRSAHDNVDTAQKIDDLYREFAMRLYASSRAPLNMEAFRTDKQIRHMSSTLDSTMSKQPFHQPLSLYSLWSLAEYLLTKKFTDKPKPWISHYTLAKCLWKSYQSLENLTANHKIKVEQVFEAIVDAIDATPRKERSNDPVLEPHFKLASIVHKLVVATSLTPQQGFEWLQATHFSKNIRLVTDEDGPEWERYILEVLKKLQQADRSNWHHRIVARRAHVIYDGDENVAGALGAKHELMQQIFTKTMTYNVWKPENERPGRHYVYTGRYVLFFAHLLDQLNDRGNLDQLVRRVRRKQADFIDHSKIWESITIKYVKLLRRVATITENRERLVFDSISYEDFTRNSEKLERWAMEPDTTSAVLDVMRDAIELKKLNNSLAKGSYIDDLIGDAYASLYEAFVAQLLPEEQTALAPPPLHQGTFINMTPDGQPQTNGAAMEGDIMHFSAPVGLGLQTPTHHFVGLPQPASTTTAGAVERAKPGRAKTVTKREIQRKADAMLLRPQPIKTPVLSKRPVIEISISSPAPNGQDGGPTDSRLEQLRDDEGSQSSTRRNSVDAGADADDESELSEGEDGIEENGQAKKVQRPLFPGLHKGREGDNQSDADDDDDMGEGGDEDEAEEDGSDEEEAMDNIADQTAADEPEIQDSQETQKGQDE